MSDVTMSTAASSTALSAPSAQQGSAAAPHSDFAADKELMLAAIARMESAVFSERASHDRLRKELSSMAEALAHAKKSVRNAATSGKPVNVGVLLTWLEARVHTMRFIIDPPEAIPEADAEPVASTPETPVAEALSAETHEAESVPTVSDVVSRLGRASDTLAVEAASLEQTAAAASDDVPTPAMLGAMVEALTAPEAVAPEIAKAETEEKAEAVALADQAQAEPPAAAALEVPQAEAPAFEEPVHEYSANEALESAAAELPAEVIEAARIEPEDIEFELAPELLIAPAPEVTPLGESEPVAEDTAPEVTAFATELGSAEAVSAETETRPAEAEAPPVEAVSEILVIEQDTITVEAVTETAAVEAVAETQVVMDDTAPVELPPSAELEVASALNRPAETEAVAEPEAALATIATDEPAALSIGETAEPESAPVAATADAEAVAVAEPPVETPDVVAAAPSRYAASLQESDLLSSFAAMEAMPFMHDDVGTAVIFEPRSDFNPAAELTAFETPVRPDTDARQDVAVVEEQEAGATADRDPLVVSEPVMQSEQPEPIAVEPGIAAIEPEASTSVEAVAIETPAFDENAADVCTETATQVSEPVVALASRETARFSVTGSLPAYAGISTRSISLGTFVTPKTEIVPEAALVTAEPAPMPLPTVALAETSVETETVAAEHSEAKIEAAAAQAIAEAVHDIRHAEPVKETAPIDAIAIAEVAETVAPAAVIEATETTAEKHEADAPVRPSYLGSAEAALAQARVELAAAAAILNTSRPRIVEVTPAPAAAATAAIDDDLEDLFEPQPDAALDPNAVLLGPAPKPEPAFKLNPATAAVLPMHDMALTPQARAEAPQVVSPLARPAAATDAVKASAPIDPLAPLKAMSDAEKIALFS